MSEEIAIFQQIILFSPQEICLAGHYFLQNILQYKEICDIIY